MEGLPVRRFAGPPPAIVALHGFTQHGGMFAELAMLVGREILAPDLPGHGGAAASPATFPEAVAAVAAVAAGRPLLGYSQGGRIALGVALEHPEAVTHLILISAGIGIADEQRRLARRADDEALARSIEREDLGPFLERWMSRPIFEGLRRRGAAWLEEDLTLRLENTAQGIATALRGMGQGAQPWYGDRLEELKMPVLFMAGDQDPRYVAIGERVTAATHGRLLVVEGAGHAIVGETPRKVALEIEQFLG
ncbi:MAG: alpha/beta fold hydrolase [Gammaproteobacteria bacterium]|nr:alpha/beta fold hydrolase [Gammaproteobacteria bacterium]